MPRKALTDCLHNTAPESMSIPVNSLRACSRIWRLPSSSAITGEEKPPPLNPPSSFMVRHTILPVLCSILQKLAPACIYINSPSTIGEQTQPKPGTGVLNCFWKSISHSFFPVFISKLNSRSCIPATNSLPLAIAGVLRIQLPFTLPG